MATPAQVKKIHVLKSDLKLDDVEYRAMLEAYVSPEGIPIWSSKDLSYDQAVSFIHRMELLTGRTPVLKARVYASPKQLRFITKKFHIRRFAKISKNQIAKVIRSLRIITRRNRSQIP
jgi:hypothetical protein